jgi:hypothetical protein
VNGQVWVFAALARGRIAGEVIQPKNSDAPCQIQHSAEKDDAEPDPGLSTNLSQPKCQEIVPPNSLGSCVKTGEIVKDGEITP